MRKQSGRGDEGGQEGGARRAGRGARTGGPAAAAADRRRPGMKRGGGGGSAPRHSHFVHLLIEGAAGRAKAGAGQRQRSAPGELGRARQGSGCAAGRWPSSTTRAGQPARQLHPGSSSSSGSGKTRRSGQLTGHRKRYLPQPCWAKFSAAGHGEGRAEHRERLRRVCVFKNLLRPQLCCSLQQGVLQQ